jgi:hypothetical protein
MGDQVSDFDQASLDWAEANVQRAKPCPFCGERLIVHTDHHGAWLAHRNYLGRCSVSVIQIDDGEELDMWNIRTEPKP